MNLQYTSRTPRDRAPRRGRTAVVAVMAAVALVFIGGCGVRQPVTDQAVPQPPAQTTTTPDGSSTLPWLSAMVARNDTTITVYGGPGDVQCKELQGPQATITEQDDDHVVIEVNARIMDAADCTSSGRAIPLVVSLPEPLGDRVLRDAANMLPRPVYFERDTPDLRSDERWSPYSSEWMSTDEGWYQGYNGPGGSVLRVSGQPDKPEHLAVVETIPIGSRQGDITGNAERLWTVWWGAGDVTYSLRLVPVEGGTFTLKQFKQELARLKWS